MIEQKHIWITGGSGSIGSALARLLAEKGAQVTISGRHLEKLNDVAAQQSGITCCPCDITDKDQVEDVVSQLSPIDIALLNAGDYQPGLSSDTELSVYEKMMQVNYFGTLHCLMALRQIAGDRPIHVAVNASLAGYRGLPNASGYGASKAALINLVESWHSELQGTVFRLQLINPGFVESDLTAKNSFTMPDLLTAEQAANYIYQGLVDKTFEITFPPRFAFKMKCLKLMPYRLYFSLMQKMTKDF